MAKGLYAKLPRNERRKALTAEYIRLNRLTTRQRSYFTVVLAGTLFAHSTYISYYGKPNVVYWWERLKSWRKQLAVAAADETIRLYGDNLKPNFGAW